MRSDKASQYFRIAEAVSKLSKDPAKKVGCVLLNPETHGVISVGFNGFPMGVNESIASRWQRPEKYSFVSHAEANAVSLAASAGVSTKNATCVVTCFPCSDCAKLLIQAGIRRVVTREANMESEKWGKSFKYSKIMLSEVGIDIQYV